MKDFISNLNDTLYKMDFGKKVGYIWISHLTLLLSLLFFNTSSPVLLLSFSYKQTLFLPAIRLSIIPTIILIIYIIIDWFLYYGILSPIVDYIVSKVTYEYRCKLKYEQGEQQEFKFFKKAIILPIILSFFVATALTLSTLWWSFVPTFA